MATQYWQYGHYQDDKCQIPVTWMPDPVQRVPYGQCMNVDYTQVGNNLMQGELAGFKAVKKLDVADVDGCKAKSARGELGTILMEGMSCSADQTLTPYCKSGDCRDTRQDATNVRKLYADGACVMVDGSYRKLACVPDGKKMVTVTMAPRKTTTRRIPTTKVRFVGYMPYLVQSTLAITLQADIPEAPGRNRTTLPAEILGLYPSFVRNVEDSMAQALGSAFHDSKFYNQHKYAKDPLFKTEIGDDHLVRVQSIHKQANHTPEILVVKYNIHLDDEEEVVHTRTSLLSTSARDNFAKILGAELVDKERSTGRDTKVMNIYLDTTVEVHEISTTTTTTPTTVTTTTIKTTTTTTTTTSTTVRKKAVASGAFANHQFAWHVLFIIAFMVTTTSSI